MRIGHCDMDTRRVRYKIEKDIAANGHKGVSVGVFMVQNVQGQPVTVSVVGNEKSVTWKGQELGRAQGEDACSVVAPSQVRYEATHDEVGVEDDVGSGALGNREGG